MNANKFFEKILNKSIKKNDICLTFDDCLKCQFDIALPILKKKIYAAFFIYSSVLDKKPNYLEIFRDFRYTKFQKC